MQKLPLVINRVEWTKGICHIWSRGRLISPSLPVGDDWYLNLNSQKRPPGRNLGEHRSVRRSGTTSRGTVVLVLSLRMRSCPRTEVLTIFLGRSIAWGQVNANVGSSNIIPSALCYDLHSYPKFPSNCVQTHNRAIFSRWPAYVSQISAQVLNSDRDLDSLLSRRDIVQIEKICGEFHIILKLPHFRVDCPMQTKILKFLNFIS